MITVQIAVGSTSDLKIILPAQEILKKLGVESRVQVLSAHRTPSLLKTEIIKWEKEGIKVVIAGAGGAAHLPGMLAAFGTIPVIGVPIAVGGLNGLDSLLSIVQMPRGVPVATVAINNGENAGILAAQIIGVESKKVAAAIRKMKSSMESMVLKQRKVLIKKNGLKQLLK